MSGFDGAIVALALATTATRVTTYVPAIPAGAPVAGSCWTRSIAAASRADAYRCIVGNSIYDPCFAPKRRGVVVCDANPASGRRGFAMRLTKPLPVEHVFTSKSPAPWLVELADGEVCSLLTGTHGLIGHETIGYECSGSRTASPESGGTGLIDGSFTTGAVWHARKVLYRFDRAGHVSGSISVVPIGAVWR